ncbi:hypothetical protein DY000_02018975 [Brassica cretica]|uniref:Uncharacterized protein n=1 Tax=Brassica cretica TaxID=69181 RepID=A0ABQ7DCY9_BRACR|nr:hypothetical protein DY000_02018975 [Brassica cretica]
MPSAGDNSVVKAARRRPPSWNTSTNDVSTPKPAQPPVESGGKRKPEISSMSPSKKLSTLSTNSVASSLKPLLPQ